MQAQYSTPYVNMDAYTYRILCELVEAGTQYYIIARKYPGILVSDAVLDNLTLTMDVVGETRSNTHRAMIYGNRRLEWRRS